MTRITGEIVIDAPADVVFDFVADQRITGPGPCQGVLRLAGVSG
jgi:hypothetical protein